MGFFIYKWLNGGTTCSSIRQEGNKTEYGSVYRSPLLLQLNTSSTTNEIDNH
jgi:hypothetical protein